MLFGYDGLVSLAVLTVGNQGFMNQSPTTVLRSNPTKCCDKFLPGIVPAPANAVCSFHQEELRTGCRQAELPGWAPRPCAKVSGQRRHVGWQPPR